MPLRSLFLRLLCFLCFSFEIWYLFYESYAESTTLILLWKEGDDFEYRHFHDLVLTSLHCLCFITLVSQWGPELGERYEEKKIPIMVGTFARSGVECLVLACLLPMLYHYATIHGSHSFRSKSNRLVEYIRNPVDDILVPILDSLYTDRYLDALFDAQGQQRRYCNYILVALMWTLVRNVIRLVQLNISHKRYEQSREFKMLLDSFFHQLIMVLVLFLPAVINKAMAYLFTVTFYPLAIQCDHENTCIS